MDLPIDLVSIDGDGIVIRIPFDAIPFAAHVALSENRYAIDEETDTTNFVVTDPQQFAEAMVYEMRKESEDGTTMVHQLLDKAVCQAVEYGAEGIEEDAAKAREFEASAFAASLPHDDGDGPAKAE